MVDATIVKVRCYGQGANRGTQSQAIGRSKGGLTTKILALTVALGNLVPGTKLNNEAGRGVGMLCSQTVRAVPESRQAKRGSTSERHSAPSLGLPSKKRSMHGASSDTPTISSNCALSRCQPIPAPGRYSLISTWRKSSAGRSNIAATLFRTETRNDGNGEASTAARRSVVYQESLLITHRPFAQSDGHDPRGLLDELVPRVATLVDDVVEGSEHSVRGSVVAHELPDVFLWVQLRAFCRQWDERDIGRDSQSAGETPAGLIDEQRGVCARTRSALGPPAGDLVLLANARPHPELVEGRRRTRPLWRWERRPSRGGSLPGARVRLFLKSSIAPSACA